MALPDEHDESAAALVEAAERAARRAGRRLMEVFGKAGDEGDGAGARAKAGTHAHDVVTDADAAAEAMIRADLRGAFPGSAVIGEEDGAAGPGDADVCWYVDPIDGTHNFLRGLPLFCVSIGVTVRGEPVGGCVYEPARDEMYTASAEGHGGTGTATGTGNETGTAPGGRLLRNGRPVPPPPPRPVPLVLTDLPRPGHPPEPAELALFADLVAAADVRRIGSAALALAYVATGRADMAVTPDAYAWDCAAGRVLVTASGGSFTAVPAPSVRRPGAFAAWRPGMADLGSAVVGALQRFSYLT
ncbi:inositol monophosphatase [Actinomadura graeca]|uniref:inositol-phosphate phosphatase n=1 Tax=Actinomadura graeca TaxID=2750812 RepID=A0ABX8R008_9ACTN|nr:inositol monophosphatase family protein [Actinomadura graeca]QXJ22373.1 inositol monophosphatase [Actinomadura graeca]